MGAAVSTARSALVSGIMDILNSIRKACMRENPTLAIIKARAEAEAAKAEAKRARQEVEAMRAEAKATREAAEAEKRQAQEELKRQRAAHAEAMRDARKMEVGWVVSAGMNNVQEVLAESWRAKESAEERARQVQRQAEEDRRNAKEAQGAAEAAAIEANERARAAKQAQQEAEERLKKGIQPVVVPSHEEVEVAKSRVQYMEDLFHFAVAGVAGGGKSSLINAFRGLRNLDTGAAPTGVTETTLAISRLPDPNEENPFVWYDIPGAGTMKIKDWQYFNEQGLYVFDCIVIVFDSRFTMTDIAMLINCKRFGIPSYIVRSKSDIHIRNIMLERGYNSDDDKVDPDGRETLYAEAREQYIADTRAYIKQNLEDANLPEQRVYMVSNSVLLSIVKNQNLPLKIIDELELMRDVFSEAYSRRCVPTLSLATLR